MVAAAISTAQAAWTPGQRHFRRSAVRVVCWELAAPEARPPAMDGNPVVAALRCVGALRGRGCAAGADVRAGLTRKAAVRTFPVEQQELFKMSDVLHIYRKRNISEFELHPIAGGRFLFFSGGGETSSVFLRRCRYLSRTRLMIPGISFAFSFFSSVLPEAV